VVERMANRTLNTDELARANDVLREVMARLEALAGDDSELLFAYRRKVAKQLIYAERSGPMARRKLKAQKREEQRNLCAMCQEPLPESYTVLDRLIASKGYTKENTRLLCEPCDRKIQKERRYT
jgi:hypothetical protein